jgi:ferritin
MNPEVVYFLNYVKTKVLPKYGLTENDVSIEDKVDYFVMDYILEHKTFEEISDWYEKAKKLHEEISGVCYVITRRKLDNLRVNGKINKSSNLLNLV